MNQNIQILSDRLIIRPIRLEDSGLIFEYRSDSLANRYQGWIPISLDEVQEFIRHRVSAEINKSGTWFQLVLIKKDSSELIGDIGIHFLDSEGFQVELGCTLNRNHQGKGYATEALTKLISFLFEELNKHRIIASIDPRNEKSTELFRRMGFRKEAHFKQSFLVNGEWVDDLVFAILKDEWISNVRPVI